MTGGRSRGAAPVIFVQLGRQVPPYLGVAMAQCRSVDGGLRPLLVGPHDGAQSRGPKLDAFRQGEHLSEQGPRGFWRYAAERLFVLEVFMERNGIDRCLHIESDNLILLPSKDVADRATRFFGSQVATCPLTEHFDTAAVLYVGSRAALSRLTAGLLDLALLPPRELLRLHGGPMANEMRMLAILRSAGLSAALPTRPRSEAATEMECIFDPASYGQWLDGTVAAPGVPYATGDHFLGPDLIDGTLVVRWGFERQDASVCDKTYDSGFVPLANVHLHSKRLSLWTPVAPLPLGGIRRPEWRHRWQARRDWRPVALSRWASTRLGLTR